MALLWVAVVLGVVEGLTEFLPVSSTGHLILAEHFLPTVAGDPETFRTVIQAGALLAVAWLYRTRFAALLRPAAPGTFGGRRGVLLLALTTVPALAIGYALRHRIHDLATPTCVAAATAVGAVALLALERLRGDRGTLTVDGLTPRIALGIGCFQCLALWPGTSRSAATIAGAMLLGVTRRAAAEYSFLAAVPVIGAASAYELWKGRAGLSGAGALHLAVGFAVSAVAAVLAVRAFVAFLGRSTMVPFAWYRLALAAAVVAFLVV